MAKIKEMKFPDTFVSKISGLSANSDRITKECLKAGAKALIPKVKVNLQSIIGSNRKYQSRSTGELAQSLGVSPPMLNKKGNHDIKIGFSEPRDDGEINAKIANILEHGKKRSGQDQKATPFLRPATSSMETQIVAAMENKLDEEISKL